MTVTDVAGDPVVSLTASGLPSGATFTPAGDHRSGTLTWTPGLAPAGSYTVPLTARHGRRGAASAEHHARGHDPRPRPGGDGAGDRDRGRERAPHGERDGGGSRRRGDR